MKKITIALLLTSISLMAEVTQITPYLNVSNSYSTFLKIFNNSTCNVRVKAVVYGDNGATNANKSIIDYYSSIPPKQTQLLWASELKTKASNIGVILGNAFGAKLTMSCTNGAELSSKDIITVIVQKSPQGQRVMPVAEKGTITYGSKIIPYVKTDPNYITFIKVMNHSNSSVSTILKAYPDSTGAEHAKNQVFPANSVTLLWADQLASSMGMTEDTYSLEISASSGLNNLTTTAVQKTVEGPRIIETFVSEKF